MTNRNFKLSRKDTGLLVIDIQEKLTPLVDRSAEVLHSIQKVIKGFQILGLPIVATEQYPQGLGSTIPGIKSVLGSNQTFLTKTSFSCLGDSSVKKSILDFPIQQWILVGIEAHV